MRHGAAVAFAALALTAALGAAHAWAGSAIAGDRGDRVQARDWAASCMTCHGPLPAGSPSPTMPSLAGRPADQIVAAMRAFRAGAVMSTVMRQIARGYSDDEITRIAAYLSTHAVHSTEASR